MKTALKTSNISPIMKTVGAFLLVLLVVVGSLLVYRFERNKGLAQVVMGNTRSADRVDILLWVGKVDPVSQTATAQVEVTPEGALANGAGMPKQDLTVYTNGLKGDTLSFKAGKFTSIADLQVALNDGVVTDYPFDSYTTDFWFDVETKDGPVPANVTFINQDTFFTFAAVTPKENSDGTVSFSANINRSLGTLAFAVFIMLFMWCLSLAALIAATYAIGGRRGLLWPAQSFMAALLFALVPLRNAVPGQPPIGSIIDYGAFFIAESLIAISLITTVVSGFITERTNEKKAQEAKAAVPTPVGTGATSRVLGKKLLLPI